MSIQDKIQRSVAPLQRKLFDLRLDHIGSSDRFLKISIEKDRWSNQEFTITADRIITAYIDFPNQEIPFTQDSGTQGFHLYDILPIEAFFKFSDNIKRKDILLRKVTFPDDSFRVLVLQVSDFIGKYSSASNIWSKYIVAPPTIGLAEYPDLKEIMNEYKAESDWLPIYDEEQGEWI